MTDEDLVLTRHPIVLSSTGSTVMVVSVVHGPDSIADMWMWDLDDPRRTIKVAAKELVRQIANHSSIFFLQQLREQIADEIRNLNAKYGNNHSLDPSPED